MERKREVPKSAGSLEQGKKNLVQSFFLVVSDFAFGFLFPLWKPVPAGTSVGMRLNSHSIEMGNRRGTHLKCSQLLCSLLWFDEDLTHVGCCISRCNHYWGPSLVGEFKISSAQKTLVFPGTVLILVVDAAVRLWSMTSEALSRCLRPNGQMLLTSRWLRDSFSSCWTGTQSHVWSFALPTCPDPTYDTEHQDAFRASLTRLGWILGHSTAWNYITPIISFASSHKPRKTSCCARLGFAGFLQSNFKCTGNCRP